MTQRLALLTILVIFVVGFLAVMGPGGRIHDARAVSNRPTAIGANPPQVGLTASYSIMGGGGSSTQDVLTFVSNGAQQTAPLTGTPTVYMIDSGTPWSALSVLQGSTNQERWITTQDTAGTISAPITVSFSYYHQYLVTFNFKVVNGGIGYSVPQVSFTQFASGMASPPGAVWADASSAYLYPVQLPGSSSSERWFAPLGTGGTISQAGSTSVAYYHQYLVSSSFSIVGGGNPAAPVLSSTTLNASVMVTIALSTQTSWLDAGSSYSFSSSMAGAKTTERWQGTVIVKTSSGNTISLNNNGTVTGAVSISPAYYHQFLVNVSFSFIGGTISGLTPPAFTYQSLAAKATATGYNTVWVDSGTQYTIPETICCTASPSTERWELTNTTMGSISAATKITSTYYNQYFIPVSYSVAGQPPPSPSAPNFAYISGGKTQVITLTQSSQNVWADSNSTYSASAILPASTFSERWSLQSASGTLGNASVTSGVSLVYNQQYPMTIIGGGVPIQWANAGSNTTLTTPGVFGRSQGTGSRIVSYQIDGGSTVALSQPSATLSIPLSINGPHTIFVHSVIQFQVSLDSGASGAVSSIAPPTIAGDNYWYDSGSSVQVTLSGIFGRSHGVGQRLSSFAVTGQGSSPVFTSGTVQAFSTNALQIPTSITTTSVTQYAVVLNNAAQSAIVSISPKSTFSNDTFWYDAGPTQVTVVLNGVFGRAFGTGSRISSWEMDSGPSSTITTTGTFTAVANSMTSAHFLNATAVTQYQLTLDKGASASLSFVSNPPVVMDNYWYDSTTPVSVIMNGVWGRGAGTGMRFSSYSINGAAPVAVQKSGLVDILNATKLSSPEFIAAVVTAQYQVTLDAGATSSLGTITTPPIPHDNYWYDSGSPVAVSLNGVWGRSATTGSRLLSYSVNAGTTTAALSSSQVQALSLAAIRGTESITTKTISQYRLTSSPVTWTSLTNSTIPGDAAGWFNPGASVRAVYNDIWNVTSSGSRTNVVAYSVDGGARTNVARSATGNFTVALSMTNTHAIVLTSVRQYQAYVVGPPKFSATPASPTGDAYFDSGSKATLTVPTVLTTGQRQGVRLVLQFYSIDGKNSNLSSSASAGGNFTTPSITFNQPHTIVFGEVAQYEVSFQFFDSTGRNSITPSLVQLGAGNTTLSVEGPAGWLTNGTSFKVVGVLWEGADVTPSSAPSFQVMAAPLNVTLDAKVYDASLKVADLLGLPVSGAQVSMTLANGTIITGTTGSDGTFTAHMIPLGTFTAKVSNLGVSAQVEGNSASSVQPVQGRVALSLITVLALVGIAVSAAVSFVFLRIRKGKAPAPSGQGTATRRWQRCLHQVPKM